MLCDEMINLSEKIEALAQRIALQRHLSVEEIIRMALEGKARMEGIEIEPRRPRDQSPEGIAARRARTDSFIKLLATMPILDERSPREIMEDLDSL